MTDITELAQSLKAAAEKATPGNWRAFQYHDGRCGIGGGHNDEIMVCEHISKERPHDAMFIALANPVNVLALVEALEKAQQHENEWKSLCEAAAVDLDDWREIDDKSRDLLCKLADTVIAKAEQSAEWERKAISNFEDCAEMSARLEELESQRKLAFAASNRWADKFREAEKRIAELESRTVTFKLPVTPEPSAYSPWLAKAFYQFHRDTVKSCFAVFSDACAAAGINVEA
ncbi:Ead domain protein [Klebsiella pneumoniae]|uniref:ead/Ea22-like family protein n=1 Tax=Klebsiella pneumoniae TaxID=573 RepID=UPI000E2D6F4B|nr:ead/Ea22-like family protein [Klebsiella pneumoniae]SVZ53269.1 Ead domain protein [Klebsiella pneumoniae]